MSYVERKIKPFCEYTFYKFFYRSSLSLISHVQSKAIALSRVFGVLQKVGYFKRCRVCIDWPINNVFNRYVVGEGEAIVNCYIKDFIVPLIDKYLPVLYCTAP